jgi:hypothetical protein
MSHSVATIFRAAWQASESWPRNHQTLQVGQAFRYRTVPIAPEKLASSIFLLTQRHQRQ